MATMNSYNMDLIFGTDVGLQWLDTKFTALALLIGNPEPLESFKVLSFIEAFRQVFGVELTRSDVRLEWITYYTKWYTENQRGHDG